VEGLQRLVRPEDVAQLRGKTIADVIPIPRPATRARAEAALALEQAAAAPTPLADDTPVEAAVEEENA